MGFVILGYLLIQLGAVVFVILSLTLWDKRNERNHGMKVPQGFERTDEVTIDPINGKRYRVYYNSSSGERFYHEET